jgi:putative transposase
MTNRAPFAPGEWYHCFSRGVEGRKTFETEKEYERFLQLLYLANSTETQHRSDLKSPMLKDVLHIVRPDTLVDIVAYCLMPNHFHLLLREKTGTGIPKFMQKLGTAYAMYFNIRHHRTGNLFVKPFRSRHVKDDAYFQRVVQYIHCNPAELYERGWKSGVVRNASALKKRLTEYPYSSLSSHTDEQALARLILNNQALEICVQPPVEKMLSEAALYYKEIAVAR